MAADLEPTTGLSAGDRDAFLQAIRADTTLGNVAALRQIGIDGTKRDLRHLLDDDLLEQAREARGWSLVAVEHTTWTVAANPDHPAWDRANARILKAYHPAFRDRVDVEHTGQMEVGSPDVAAAIDRFTALADAAIRAAARTPTKPAALPADRQPESPARLPLGRLARPPRPTPTR